LTMTRLYLLSEHERLGLLLRRGSGSNPRS
jgi:hypothetical protein